MSAGRSYTLGAVVLTWSLGLAHTAHAQFAASAAVQSDYRFRGLSYSDGRPTVSLDVAYDHASGLYLGASAVGVDTAHAGARTLGWMEYLGYAVRLADGFSWDFGVKNANITEYKIIRRDLNYDELYVGLTKGDLSAHLYYSPNYFSPRASTIYADIDAVARLTTDWRLVGHAGVMTPLGGPSYPGARQERYDLRAGVAREFRRFELDLSWTASAPDQRFQSSPEGSAVVAGLTCFF